MFWINSKVYQLVPLTFPQASGKLRAIFYHGSRYVLLIRYKLFQFFYMTLRSSTLELKSPDGRAKYQLQDCIYY